MVERDYMTLSGKELKRLHVIRQVVDQKIKPMAAVEWLGLSSRQIRRLVKRVRMEGEKGLVHRNRGRSSNRAISPKRKTRILRLYQAHYGDFGPTLAAEKLVERDGIPISDETLRLWLLQEGVTHFRRRSRPHRQWRERKHHCGEMLQGDGSHHDWFEGRGPACVLMAYIDDATSRVFARFYEYEGTFPAMESFRRYVLRYGLPLCVYLDRHSTYQSQASPTIEEELLGQRPMSQFERALHELGVEIIHAHSPQAKGRIERLFNTFQDRLVKEMRLAKICTLEEGNRFLEDYLPRYNQRFCVTAMNPVDLHRPCPSNRVLEGILCIRTTRVLRNDFTVAHNGKLYQVDEALRGKKVLVQERLDGSMRLTYQGRSLRYHEITARPVPVPPPQKAPLRRSPAHKPSPDHPWRRAFAYANH